MRIVYPLVVSWGGIPQYTAALVNAISEYGVDTMVIKPKDANDGLFLNNTIFKQHEINRCV